MKKLIKANSYQGYIPTSEESLQSDKRCLLGAYKKMQELFDILDYVPKGFTERYGLTDLYDELNLVIRETDDQLREWHLK